MTYSLAIKTTAANDDRLVRFEATSPSDLLEVLLAHAPDVDSYLYYRHKPVGQYFRLYDGQARTYLTFRRKTLDKTQIDRAWSAVQMMARVEREAVERLGDRPMTPAIARHYPKIPAIIATLPA